MDEKLSVEEKPSEVETLDMVLAVIREQVLQSLKADGVEVDENTKGTVTVRA